MCMMKTMRGSNALIVKGEKCVRNARDILMHYPGYREKLRGEESIQQIKMIPENLKEIYDSIDKKGKNIDEISRLIKKSPWEVLSSLTILEMQGMIKRYPGNIFVHT